MHSGTRGLGVRVAGIAASFAAMLVPGAAPAQSVAPSSAPVEWIRYAEASTRMISVWLQDETEAPSRFRAYLDATRSAGNAPVEIEISLWPSPGGNVERIHFAPFADAQANVDLQRSIVGRDLGAPPRGMLLPMRVAVQVEPHQETDK